VTGAALLEVDSLSKHFGGLAAVDGLTFSVGADETFGIAGPNGAGKTTLFDVITGLTSSTSGRIVLAGEEIQGRTSHGICHRGVARTFQIPAVFPDHTVLGNIVVGAYFGRRAGVPSIAFGGAAVEGARSAAAFVGLEDKLGVVAGPLSLFDKKRLMIASAIATSPQLLMLDEPVGGLNPGEVDAVLGLVTKVRASGVTVILIEHVMRALMAISDRVMVMNHGRLLFEGTPAEVQRHEEVIRVYLGTEPASEETADRIGGDADA
jgi:branched-chain amino acid transport system ATP-binding protein